MSSVSLTISPAWGVSSADSTTSKVAWKPYYGNGAGDFSTTYLYPWPGRGPNLKREGGNLVGVNGYTNIGDHHVVLVRTSDCEIFETYNDRLGGETFKCADRQTSGCNISSINIPYGFGSSLISNGPYAMPFGSTDAAGLPLAPLSWNLAEIKAGAIKHAARFTTSIGYINGRVWPAVTANAYSPYAPPYGARFLLRKVTDGGPDPVRVCTPAGEAVNMDCLTMLAGLQQYGMILADIGLNNEIQTFTDLTSDATTRAAIRLIAESRIPISSFFVVDESSLQETSSLGFQTFANGSYAVNPFNAYVVPVSSAVVVATPVSGASPIFTNIALQGTAIGVQSNELTIVAGMEGYSIKSWISPSVEDQRVRWSLTSGVGSVTSDGVYTPPASTIAGDTALLTATALADPSVTANVSVKVLGTEISPVPGTIRIDSASEVNTIDGAGHIWSADSGVEASVPTESTPDYPPWPGVEGVQYGTVLYTRSGDISYDLTVPNGNYKVRLMYGQILNGESPSSVLQQLFISNPITIEAQGNIVAHNADWNVLSGFRYQSPVDIFVPARVTNNKLQIKTMVTTPDTPISADSGIGPLYPGLFPYFLSPVGVKSASINGIEIMPDSGPAHWQIDAQGATTLKAGQRIQLYVVDWYTGYNDPVWTIVSGPSGVSVDGRGLLIAQPGSLAVAQPIVVMASDGRYSASITFNPSGTSPVEVQRPLQTPPPKRDKAPVSPNGFVRTITVPRSGFKTTFVNFPLLVSLVDPLLADQDHGGHVVDQDGDDILFSADPAGTQLLDWEREEYDSLRGRWIGHVRMPQLSSSAETVFYMSYGKAGGRRAASNNPAAVWDKDYLGVYHFGSSQLMKDSTRAAVDGTASNWHYTRDGLINGAADASGGFATVPVKSMLSRSSGTLEVWAYNRNTQDATHSAGLFEQDMSFSEHDAFYLGWSAYWNDFEVTWRKGGVLSKMAASADKFPLPVRKWNHIAYTWNRETHSQNLYLNGLRVVTSAQPFGNPSFESSFTFSFPYNPSYYGITGSLDEARFSSTVRSSDWIAQDYRTQKFPRSFSILGPERGASSSGANSRAASSRIRTVKQVALFVLHFFKRVVANFG